MKIFILGVYRLKILETDLQICFVDKILDAVMKLSPIGFLSILKKQYIIKTQLFNIFFIFSGRYSATLKGRFL